jgi:glutathione S-transferase
MSQTNQASAKAVVIMFPPSIDCALARFLLAYYDVAYEERRHTILFTFIPTLWYGGTLRFPLLFGDGYPKLASVQEMIDYFDPRCPAGRNLRLTGKDAESVAADWEQFHETLGTAVTAFAYYHLLPLRSVMIRPLTEGTPAVEEWAVRLAYPLFAGFIRFGLKLSDGAAQQGLAQIRDIVKSVEGRLADGRRFLVGDRFSLSDMSLANALAPLVLAPQYGGPLPTFDEMPPELQAVTREMQASPAGQFALRIYRDHMKPPA